MYIKTGFGNTDWVCEKEKTATYRESINKQNKNVASNNKIDVVQDDSCAYRYQRYHREYFIWIRLQFPVFFLNLKLNATIVIVFSIIMAFSFIKIEWAYL